MIRKIATITFQSGALVALLGSLLFAGGVLGSSPGILGSSLRFIAAICRDSSTQWMVMACLASHFMTLLMVERRMNLAPSATGVTDLKSGCEDEESGQRDRAFGGKGIFERATHPKEVSLPQWRDFHRTPESFLLPWLLAECVDHCGWVAVRLGLSNGGASSGIPRIVGGHCGWQRPCDLGPMAGRVRNAGP